MKHTYHIEGMTCNGCLSLIRKKLLEIDTVVTVDIDLESSKAVFVFSESTTVKQLQKVLPDRYRIKEEVTSNIESVPVSKIKQLRPLLLIFAYLFSAVFLLNYKAWNTTSAMLDFMGLFYIVFSFFKFLDLKGFPESFKMYDPLAKLIPVYGKVYPFVELILGLFFLMRFKILIALVLTILVLGITTIGVAKALLDKKNIRCACLGTALKLPMTEATFIENTIMLLMAIVMLFSGFNF